LPGLWIETNRYDKLSQGGEKVQCGWLRDKYSLSWQVIPSILIELLADADPKNQAASGTQ
jgi:predicted 3-demethylubiquinone-9 3-methyltransferase (glyoxalase superfamily)